MMMNKKKKKTHMMKNEDGTSYQMKGETHPKEKIPKGLKMEGAALTYATKA